MIINPQSEPSPEMWADEGDIIVVLGGEAGEIIGGEAGEKIAPESS